MKFTEEEASEMVARVKKNSKPTQSTPEQEKPRERKPRAKSSGYSKYNAKKTVCMGIVFDSKKEAGRYSDLFLMERAGEIKNLTLQPKFVLLKSFYYFDYNKDKKRKSRELIYISDFRYEKDGKIWIEDVKGMKTKVYLMKKKLFLSKFPELCFIES